MRYTSTNKIMKQTTNNIMMIEPVLFNYNSETAVNNYYQSNDLTLSNEKVQLHLLRTLLIFVRLQAYISQLGQRLC